MAEEAKVVDMNLLELKRELEALGCQVSTSIELKVGRGIQYPEELPCPICGQPMKRTCLQGTQRRKRRVAYECHNPCCPVIRYVPSTRELHLEARRRRRGAP